MVTADVIQRTFHIKYNDAVATCFTIDVDNKQYIVTAKHVIEGFPDFGVIELFKDSVWIELPAKLVGHCSGSIDISVLALDRQISPSFPLEPTSSGLAYGQDVYFLGFPHMMRGEAYADNNGFPFPFVKKAIVSWIAYENGIQTCYLDGHNNPGFSGGPVVFERYGEEGLKVCAVISAYRYSRDPVYQGENAIPYEVRSNTGIIISYGIQHAVALIRENPIGAEVNV